MQDHIAYLIHQSALSAEGGWEEESWLNITRQFLPCPDNTSIPSINRLNCDVHVRGEVCTTYDRAAFVDENTPRARKSTGCLHVLCSNAVLVASFITIDFFSQWKLDGSSTPSQKWGTRREHLHALIFLRERRRTLSARKAEEDFFLPYNTFTVCMHRQFTLFSCKQWCPYLHYSRNFEIYAGEDHRSM